jgi:hypothetical protein
MSSIQVTNAPPCSTPHCRMERVLHPSAKALQHLYRATNGRIVRFQIQAFNEKGELIGAAEQEIAQAA